MTRAEEQTARDVVRVAVFHTKVRLYRIDGLLSGDEARAYNAAAYRIAFRRIAKHVERQITINALRDIATSGKITIT